MKLTLAILITCAICFFAMLAALRIEKQKLIHGDGTSLPPANDILRENPDHPSYVNMAQIDFFLPNNEDAASDALEENFFNKLELTVFSKVEVSKENRCDKWRVFSDALVARAKNENLDFKSLDACLKALNYGQNEQTMVSRVPLPAILDMFGDQAAAANKRRQEEYEKAQILEEIDKVKNPERYYDESLGIIPVSAYLARYSGGECWIIVCKWEYLPDENTKPSRLGHVKVWAMDAQTAKVVAFVTCD